MYVFVLWLSIMVKNLSQYMHNLAIWNLLIYSFIYLCENCNGIVVDSMDFR